MKSHAWYVANSLCRDGETSHDGQPVLSVLGDLVGYICPHCLDAVIRVRRGSPLWISTEVTA